MKVVERKSRDEMIEEAGETEGARRGTGVFPAGASASGAATDVEVVAKAERRRGPKTTTPDPREKKIAELEREVGRQTKRAERAEALVELKKKVASLLGTPLESEK